MEKEPENPPAFPALNHPQGHAEHWVYAGTPGMTLRDYFAAKAMQGLLANPKLSDHILKSGQSWIAESSYGWANDMLRARKI